VRCGPPQVRPAPGQAMPAAGSDHGQRAASRGTGERAGAGRLPAPSSAPSSAHPERVRRRNRISRQTPRRCLRRGIRAERRPTMGRATAAQSSAVSAPFDLVRRNHLHAQPRRSTRRPRRPPPAQAFHAQVQAPQPFHAPAQRPTPVQVPTAGPGDPRRLRRPPAGSGVPPATTGTAADSAPPQGPKGWWRGAASTQGRRRTAHAGGGKADKHDERSLSPMRPD